MAPIFSGDGYGNCASGLATQLKKYGVNILNMMGKDGSPPKWGGSETWLVDDEVVILDIPPFWEKVCSRKLAGFTMFESTKLPDEFVRSINRIADAVLVPNQFCYDIFKEQTNAPVFIIPLGIDTERYTHITRARTEDDPFTILWSGTPDLRKGWDVAYSTFCEAFRGRDDVRLIMHFRSPLVGSPTFTDSNVETIIGRISDDEWLALLTRSDLMLYPARGEGHGMVPREAASTGLPVICTRWGGMSDCNEWAMDIPISGLVPASYGGFNAGSIGEWGEPDREMITNALLWGVSNRTSLGRWGRVASWFIHENQNWERCSSVLHSWMLDKRWIRG